MFMSLPRTRPARWPRRAGWRYSRGLSIVELLVGVAIGLFLLAGASAMLVSSIISSRGLLAEARVNQNLRSAADLITRDLRRAGYWENAMAGTTTTGTASTANPNAGISASTGSSTITYSLARDAAAGRAANNTLEDDEKFAFGLSAGAIQMQVGSSTWQAVTDVNVLTMTALTITPVETSLDIRDSCAIACCDAVSGTCAAINVTVPPGCPKITVRRYDISLTGQSTTDSAVVRTLRTSVRVRNDASSGACPI